MDIDRCIAVDWSAANRPVRGADSIWIATADRDGVLDSLTNPPTRAEAVSQLRRELRSAVEAGERAVVGVDAGFGYPAGFASALAGRPADWRVVWQTIWAAIDDDQHNRSTRFEVAATLNRRLGGGAGPFWACPPSAAGPHLATRRGPMPMRTADGTELAEYRAVEELLRSRCKRPHSVWKLFTPGSVGSQTLLAIARLHELLQDPFIGTHSRIWPFEVDAATLEQRPLVLFVELWPELAEPDLDEHPIRDAAQVLAASRWIARLAADDDLADLLLLTAVDDETRRIAQLEEGWILGAERV